MSSIPLAIFEDLPSKMNIRNANFQDIDSLAEIANSAFKYSIRWLKPARWANNYFHALLNTNSCHIWVLEQNGQCCGFLMEITDHNDIRDIKRSNRITLYEIIVKATYNPYKFIKIALHKFAKLHKQVNYKILLGDCSSDKEAWIESLAVHPDHRKKGIGEILTKYCLDYNRKNNVRYVGLLVAKNNIPAISLYKKVGFRLVEYV